MPSILIVDDDVDLSAIVARYLESEGFAVERAVSAEEAYDVLATRAFDLVLLDIKQADPERHRTLTGRDNAQTLRTAAWLEEHGKPFWLRYVLVPGYSDAEADIRALGERLGGYKQVERVEILPYHTLGVHKYEAMGKEYRLAGVQENTPEQSERAAALFREYFPTVVVN